MGPKRYNQRLRSAKENRKGGEHDSNDQRFILFLVALPVPPAGRPILCRIEGKASKYPSYGLISLEAPFPSRNSS
jgi:hypothetical protein